MRFYFPFQGVNFVGSSFFMNAFILGYVQRTYSTVLDMDWRYPRIVGEMITYVIDHSYRDVK